MMSVAKSVATLCALVLVERGQLALDSTVSRYWPEFGQAGKESVTVEQLLGGLAGVIYLDHAPVGSLLDRAAVINAIEKQAPAWPVGTRGAYHSMTWGYLLSELVERVDGRAIDEFYRQEISAPLEIDYQMGLTDDELTRVVDIIPNSESTTLSEMVEPDSNIGRAWRVMPKVENFFNSERFRRAVFPSASGHGNARSIARVYSLLSLGGTLDGTRLLSRELIENARTARWDGECGLTGRSFRFGLGFFLNKPPLTPMGSNLRAFGHPGAGGAIGIADPERRLSFSYSPNYMCGGAGVGSRCEALVHAALGSL
jgi:CubicO group peptidase (beta-lactamase class C family)